MKTALLMAAACLCATGCTSYRPRQAEVRVSDGDGNGISEFPLRFELGEGLEKWGVSPLEDDAARKVHRTKTDAGGVARLVYYDGDFDINRDQNSGLSAIIYRDRPPVGREFTVVPLKPLPAGSKITFPAPHVGAQ